jgi:translation initiation factor 3 subunit B
LLSKEQRKQVRKNLKEFSRVFDEEDAAEESTVSAELIAHRKRLVDEWNTWRNHCRRELEVRRQENKSDGELDGEEREEVQEWIEEVIEQTEEVIESS